MCPSLSNPSPYLFDTYNVMPPSRSIYLFHYPPWRRGGLVVERRTPEREVGGSILTQVAVLYP